MKRMLVTYATNAGSTAEVARAVGDGLGRDGVQVEVMPIEAVTTLDAYDAVVVGAPMIFGWHREARAFLKEHQEELRHVPVAYFMVALSLTESEEDVHAGARIYQDASLAKAPKNLDRLSFRERFTSVANYVQPALDSAPGVTPVNIGFFNGTMDYGRLNLFERLFVQLAFGATEGDFRNWDAIQAWSEDLSAELVDAITGQLSGR
jgi:menaquinone-dependent protoporphyrinogen oxidase